MVMKLGKFFLAASLLALFSSPALAEEPSKSISRLESIVQDYASIPRSELINTSIEERGPIVSKLQRDLIETLDNVDYEQLSNIEAGQQYYFTKLTQRIQGYIDMLQTKADLSQPS